MSLLLSVSRRRGLTFVPAAQSFESVQRGFEKLVDISESFESTSITQLLKSAPDLTPLLDVLRSLFEYDKEEGSSRRVSSFLPSRGFALTSAASIRYLQEHSFPSEEPMRTTRRSCRRFRGSRRSLRR